MTASNSHDGKGRGKGAYQSDPKLARRVALNRTLAKLVLFCEHLAPLLLLPASIAAIFLCLSWFGLFAAMPSLLRWPLVLALTFGFLAAFLPFARLRWPKAADADRLLEERNHLPHQPVSVQEDEPAFDTPFARALWHEHQKRMARKIASLDPGLPRPDIARFDRNGLRAIPALLLAIAFAYSGSNGAGRISDAFRTIDRQDNGPSLRVDAWITPPGYTGQPPVFLTNRNGEAQRDITVPAQSVITVRFTGGTDTEKAVFKPATTAGTIALQTAEAPKDRPDAAPADANARSLTLTLTESGTLDLGQRQWPLTVIADKPPTIVFDGIPKPTVNGALEIGYIAKDDYGVQEARAEIVPVVADLSAQALYPLPEYKLDLPHRNAKEVKSRASHNLSDHPLAGKKVRITLIAKDGLGQEGKSQPYEMIFPSRPFNQPLAAAVAEERQVFALDTRKMARAIDLNDAITLRADETIPNLSHYLLIKSARARMALANDTDAMKDTASYLWDIALGIDDGDVPLAERKLSEAQQKLSDALERNAPDAEIKRLTDELRQAMQDYMKALAQRQQPQNGQPQQNANKTMTQRDLENMMNQIENLSRSGNKDAARQILSELQRLMNNLQTGRMQRPDQQQQQQSSEARKQIDKLGQLMQDQQKLMDETFKLNQALQDRMQMGDPSDENSNNETAEQQQKPAPGQSPSSPDQMTQQQLRDALKGLRERQDGLGKQLKQLQEGLGKLGVKPGKDFGQAQQEMRGAGENLGKGNGDNAIQGQGRAMEALRQGARDMMNQMMQAMRNQQGQGQGQNQGMAEGQQPNGRDPLGRPRPSGGPELDESVRIPDEIDVQRAREILDAIRDKLGNNASPDIERRYLERLLDLQ
ncbi:TIGR02302 family protein [Rhizobium sp.]|jgi:uncharacterized protein (TIGR02302 family)|uniref:TIGR02302 family protein n=1 Tax=Rhizobium sp. TaxID=391 RepID=UPI000E858F7A|nr:TIGR02302 family protein [Rhizobium sp.]